MLIIFGVLFMLCAYAAVGAFSGAGWIFLNLPSALLVFAPLLFFLVASKSGRVLGRYVSASFRKDPAYTKAELATLSRAAKNAGKFVLWAGAFAFLAGTIAALAFLGSPGSLGPNVAISLITLAYAVSANCFVFLPVRAWAENKASEMS